ncbi:hypothetical protein KUTeg_007172 [Tegillarca granosa]|uniref:Uncharacterized protein n=1 Tax=Tegillarca granosa TaxID=220873 RepID=A0ABQ9FCH7_TEGGR|nr:hypothetical protein KUTeg_007172 [Tegillarca granosa]
MEQVPAAMDRHLDVIQCHKDGGILLGASSLTGRYWLGSLWFYNNPENAPDVEKCTGGVQLEAGLRGVAMWQLEDNFSTFVHQHSATDHDNLVNSVSVSSDKKSAVSGSRDCCVKVWDLETLAALKSYHDSYKQIYRNTSHRDFVRGLSWSSNNKLFTCGWDSQVIAHSISEVSETSKSDSEPVVMEVNGDINTEQSDDKIKCNGTGTDVSESGDAKITT